ncbi:MAG: 6-carboxytetrahydropterin synthase QueD [Chloroflexi bacterium]|nr:6-carboxytetrahydropterin synthase QueD [Chloroflexota bacterium]
MYQIFVEDHFDAAHALRGYQGKCENLHGHRFKVVVRIKASVLDNIGLAYDFRVLKQHIADVISPFDHTSLNDVPPFDKINPSSENIAATIYKELSPKLAGDPVTLTAVEVWESPITGVVYSLE